ncbi:TPA: DUF1398 family protein [Streptococcus suis]|uniref:DUF1398 domain-containing protein n=5 Tax=Streptococcus suis TaxID=1307 RepID=A0A0H3N1C3_STRS4|nr:DUF1398 family protein [Streptococcus suis]ABP90732.1 Phage envelope protein [Streptococcus suis 05ZYH33]ABP92935.1 Phage envelope protein [Streptococcus suis 98HAH33]ADE32049.1 Phage envelope protein [Streptococcus suis GZ1]AFR01018.1 Phage envelope protein [Streptococcus suis S735]AGG65092.1 Phage envelope protein [Streptococcus suis SC070731]
MRFFLSADRVFLVFHLKVKDSYYKERRPMFTLENINHGHEQFTGPDFPKLIAYFKDLGMVENIVDIQSGQVTYRSQTGQTLEKQGYQVTIPVSDQANLDQFVTILRNHQAGQTDFLTFCQETAEAGIYKWVIDLEAMTCSYMDKAEQAVFVETIPSVEN